MATTTLRSGVRAGWRAFCLLVVVLGILVIGAAVVAPRLAGATPYTVLTGSMTPTYPPGTLVVVRPAAPDELKVGDVVTYQLRSGEPAVVTHRVVAVGRNTVTDEVVLTTRGDANAVADAEPVREVQVRGTVWYAVPWVGHVGAALGTSTRQSLVYVAAGVLFAYGAWAFRSGLRERRARAASGPDNSSASSASSASGSTGAPGSHRRGAEVVSTTPEARSRSA